MCSLVSLSFVRFPFPLVVLALVSPSFTFTCFSISIPFFMFFFTLSCLCLPSFITRFLIFTSFVFLCFSSSISTPTLPLSLLSIPPSPSLLLLPSPPPPTTHVRGKVEKHGLGRWSFALTQARSSFWVEEHHDDQRLDRRLKRGPQDDRINCTSKDVVALSGQRVKLCVVVKSCSYAQPARSVMFNDAEKCQAVRHQRSVFSRADQGPLQAMSEWKWLG